jgi:hypothetical protein
MSPRARPSRSSLTVKVATADLGSRTILLRAALAAACAATLALATRARAEDAGLETERHAPAMTGWQTASHLGFGVVDRSSTGFRSTQGSMLFLDAGRTLPGVAADWQLGLRTIGEGGQRAGQEFYRMAAGPFVGYRPAAGWLIHGAVGAFREAGLDGDQPRYRSTGWLGMVGWERTYAWGSRVELGLGGFLMRHLGNVSTDGAGGTAAAVAAVPRVNEGLSHGVEAALRVRL